MGHGCPWRLRRAGWGRISLRDPASHSRVAAKTDAKASATRKCMLSDCARSRLQAARPQDHIQGLIQSSASLCALAGSRDSHLPARVRRA
eukprot:4923069-Prymnesium_polylepis.1